MNWSDLDLRPDTNKLRQFALFGCGLVLALAAVVAFRHGAGNVRLYRFVPAVLFFIAAVCWPVIAKPVYVILTVASFPVGWIVSRIILFAVYMAVLTPVATVLRWSGRDVLSLRRTARQSYWKERQARLDVKSYFAQF